MLRNKFLGLGCLGLVVGAVGCFSPGDEMDEEMMAGDESGGAAEAGNGEEDGGASGDGSAGAEDGGADDGSEPSPPDEPDPPPPQTCGNGMLDSGEECDLAGSNSDNGACTSACKLAVCGDGHVELGVEECDDGNGDDVDACLTTCAVATCGDGFVQDGVEECDDANIDDADGCWTDCSARYWAVGPQRDVLEADLVLWDECWSGPFNATTPIADVLAACDGDHLMLACRATGSATFDFLAHAPRADVLFDTGNAAAGSHDANGAQWYYSAEWSWGFAPQGTPLNRNSCDTEGFGALVEDARMCMHTGGASLQWGYRCGDDTTSTGERVFLQPVILAP